jgi:hypothetical protein
MPSPWFYRLRALAGKHHAHHPSTSPLRVTSSHAFSASPPVTHLSSPLSVEPRPGLLPVVSDAPAPRHHPLTTLAIIEVTRVVLEGGGIGWSLGLVVGLRARLVFDCFAWFFSVLLPCLCFLLSSFSLVLPLFVLVLLVFAFSLVPSSSDWYGMTYFCICQAWKSAG